MKWLVPGAMLLLVFFLHVPAQADTTTEAGRKIYNFRCYFCHGYSGNAKTVAAGFVDPSPTDFTKADPQRFTRDHIVEVLKHGKPGTAMKPFVGILSNSEIEQVAAFVFDEFVRKKAPNTRYHTAENGWPNHERYRAAFPFVTGEIPPDSPWERLTAEQTAGKKLYLSSCVSCHSHGQAQTGGLAWNSRPLSYPRNQYSHTDPPSLAGKNKQQLDAMSSASPYVLHDIPPTVNGLTPQEKHGKQLFEANCAFCHGADGTGKNWIGSFLEPHPRNLRDSAFMKSMTRALLTARIREGLPNTSMPAWKDVLSNEEIAAVVAYIGKVFYPLPN